MGLWGRFMSGLGAFRQEFMSSSDEDLASFEGVKGRRMRYEVYWAFYSNTAYSRVHSWAAGYKTQEKLYKFIRNVYNPSYRIGEFYREHLLGGLLDVEDPTRGAVPIVTENDALLGAIATLWRVSNMQVLKDVVSLRGAIEGDVFLVVTDDPARGKVMIERVSAGSVADLTLDEAGNVKGYVIEENRENPETGRDVTYTEEVTRDGEFVVYQTYMNGAPYGWYGQPSEWAIPYGFVPMVHIQHNNVGLDFGWSELHPLRGKVQEVDEQASLLSDYLRKYSDPVWLASGKRMANVEIDDGDATEDQEGRNRLKIVSGFQPGTEVKPLVADMRVNHTLAHIDALQSELERDYPELQHDIWATGATSGKALRVARERVTSKALQRRGNYDSGLTRIQQMAVAIGGYRGYDGFAGFGLGSYDAGALDHRIDDRPVFEPDPLDQAELDRLDWEVINLALKAGASLGGILQARGYTDEQVQELTGPYPGDNRGTDTLPGG